MDYAEASTKLQHYRRDIADIRRKMRETLAAAEPESVTDYEFAGPTGPVRLSDLFGRHDDLMVVHNMGRHCAYCTLWADGYNGIHAHVTSRAAFVVCSPDSAEEQQAFAASRGWVFPMVSHRGTRFAADMGYVNETGGLRPGLSVFRRDGGRILRVSDTELGPGDDFCTLWHFFDLLPGGAGDWSPKFAYP